MGTLCHPWKGILNSIGNCTWHHPEEHPLGSRRLWPSRHWHQKCEWTIGHLGNALIVPFATSTGAPLHLCNVPKQLNCSSCAHKACWSSNCKDRDLSLSMLRLVNFAEVAIRKQAVWHLTLRVFSSESKAPSTSIRHSGVPTAGALSDKVVRLRDCGTPYHVLPNRIL